MSLIEPVAAATPFESVLGRRPELLERYRAFYASIWEDGRVPRRVLELCRLRIAAIHDCAAEWSVRDAGHPLTDAELAALRRGDTAGFAVGERAALALAEKIPYQHHAITDAEVKAAERELDAPGAVLLLTALAFFDVTCRLKLTLEIPEQALALAAPPLHRGSLV